MAFLLPLIAGVGSGVASTVSSAASSASVAAAQNVSEMRYSANQAELLASNTQINTAATKSSEATNTEEFHVAVEEAHNHVVRSYIDAVKQVQ